MKSRAAAGKRYRLAMRSAIDAAGARRRIVSTL
jgi:hypothetical protein